MPSSPSPTPLPRRGERFRSLSRIATEGWSTGLERVGTGAALLTPIFLMHGHGIAEGTIALTDFCFLAASFRRRDWRWLRTRWLTITLAWWLWVLICSVLAHQGSILQSALQLRFFMFVAALEQFALRDGTARRWMFRVIAACAVWIVGHCAYQLVMGRNLFGWPRGPAGELTGPFRKPRAGPPLSRIMLPVLLPSIAALLARRRRLSSLAAGGLVLGGVCTMVLISQRMPLILVILGLVVSAILLERLRSLVAVAVITGGVLIAASAVVAPISYQRLVVRFSQQIGDFGGSHYGRLYARAAEIGLQNPWTGLGLDGFRHACEHSRYFGPSWDGSDADDGGAEICTQHPHNFYAEAFDSGGFPGLALFVAVSIAWLIPLASGLWHDPNPLRVGLFAAVLIQLWPIASTSGFNALPMGGWLFLLLGWGLAEARAASPSPAKGRGRR